MRVKNIRSGLAGERQIGCELKYISAFTCMDQLTTQAAHQRGYPVNAAFVAIGVEILDDRLRRQVVTGRRWLGHGCRI